MNAHIGRTLTLGVGSAPSHHLLEGIAKAGNGTCAFIDSDANIHKQTLAQLKNALQPSLTSMQNTKNIDNAGNCIDFET